MIELGHEVVGCDNLLGGYLDNVHEKIKFTQYDCNYFNSIVKITSTTSYITVLRLRTKGLKGIFCPIRRHQSCDSPRLPIYTAAISNGVKAHRQTARSMARYGENVRIPSRGTMTPKPQDPYEIGKDRLRSRC